MSYKIQITNSYGRFFTDAHYFSKKKAEKIIEKNETDDKKWNINNKYKLVKVK